MYGEKAGIYIYILKLCSSYEGILCQTQDKREKCLPR